MAGVAILCAAPDVMAAPGAQRTPGGGYVPRPVTIRRLPGGRILRIVSRAHGGMMNRIAEADGMRRGGAERRDVLTDFVRKIHVNRSVGQMAALLVAAFAIFTILA